MDTNQPSKNRVVKASRKTVASRWNVKLLRRLEAALKTDPEADLRAHLPANYSQTLQSFKRCAARQAGEPQAPNAEPRFRDDDVRSSLSAAGPVTVLSELSPELSALLHGHHEHLAKAIVDLLAEGEVIFQTATAASVTVFRVGKTMAVKLASEENATTELGSLLYLQQHVPALPAPRPHGLLRMGDFYLLFTTFIPGLDLENAWPRLDDTQKRHVSLELDKMLSTLRSLQCPSDTPLGGVQGEGCKDLRRFLRVSKEPVMNAKQFEDFIFSGSKAASPLYVTFLREFLPALPAKCVFTHGDIRPANIMVDQGEDGTWSIVAIIDWETSGFYPEYWEAVKMTNNLSSIDNFDWYRYLPESVSPRQYPVQWLVDRLWDRNLVNS